MPISSIRRRSISPAVVAAELDFAQPVKLAVVFESVDDLTFQVEESGRWKRIVPPGGTVQQKA